MEEEECYTPCVSPTYEFVEIARDFSNPLDLVREAISNGFDADASKMKIGISVEKVNFESVLVIRMEDNGHGMSRTELHNFFDLGNSTRRDNDEAIGEKGHGTKVYFNSAGIEVDTTKDGVRNTAVMKNPLATLTSGVVPDVNIVKQKDPAESSGTIIIVRGYNQNDRDCFTHNQVRDFILWFTKVGSIEQKFGHREFDEFTLELKGLDRDDYELIKFGHVFPKESAGIDKLFETYYDRAPSYYCKQYTKKGHLKKHPEVAFEAFFSIEGDQVKYSYNSMLRRRGYQAPAGAYTMANRYGLWLCKDYIPVQRKNEWISTKSEYTKYHAFVNCQALELTANRGSVDNTRASLLEDLQECIEEIRDEIVESDNWQKWEDLEAQAAGYRTVQEEKRDYKKRTDNALSAEVAEYKNHLLVKPRMESGVMSLCVIMETIEPTFLPFSIIDYDTHKGIDVIVKMEDSTPIVQSKLQYVEFKYWLAGSFNHSFENLHSIVCWGSKIKNGEKVTDIAQQERTMVVVQPKDDKDYTRYYLEDIRQAHKIEVFVLESYLPEKFGISFRNRNEKDIL